MPDEMNICKYYQSGYWKKKINCDKKHIIEECKERVCINSNCFLRHRRLCYYFETFGRCKFGSSCKFRHRKGENIEIIEHLESEVRNYKEKYELFLKFFKNDINDNELQANIKTETCAVNVLSDKIKILQRDNNNLS